jgi:hypothetical protein
MYVPAEVPADPGAGDVGGVEIGVGDFTAEDEDEPHEAKQIKTPAKVSPRINSVRLNLISSVKMMIDSKVAVMVGRMVVRSSSSGAGTADDCAVVVTIRDVPSFVHVP